MREKIESIKKEVLEKINCVEDSKKLYDLKVEYLGKKGPIQELLAGMGSLSIEEKKEFGPIINGLKNEITELFDNKNSEFEAILLNQRLENERIDITLPSTKVKTGSKHPMTRIQEQFEDLFVSMGYTIYEGPEFIDKVAERLAEINTQVEYLNSFKPKNELMEFM